MPNRQAALAISLTVHVTGVTDELTDNLELLELEFRVQRRGRLFGGWGIVVSHGPGERGLSKNAEGCGILKCSENKSPAHFFNSH